MGRRGRGAIAVLALALAVAVLGPFEAPSASAQTGEALVEACQPATEVPEVGSRLCGGTNALVWLAAQHCRRVPPAQEPMCPSIDGRPVHEAAMAAYETGWTARALDLQRDLDLDVPLLEGLVLHTHNSGNSAAYDPSLTINDANQVVSVTDQLRLGIRGIELDLHWTPNPAGDPDQGFRAVVQCHGQSADTPAGSVHPGCSVDRTFDAHLAELRAWLDRPEAADELVLLYLENQLGEDEAAHASAVASLETHLGDLLFRPQAGAGCQELPVTRTKRELLETGARVLLTGNCGPAGWTDLVFERGDAWDESGSSTDYLAGSTCDAERAAGAYGSTFVRRYEDSTFLSLMVNGGSHISPEVAAAMVRCGVNMPGLDQVHAGDERLPAFVWSWREGEPVDDPARGCAAQGDDGRFGALPCETVLPVACRTADGGWAPSSAPATWADGDVACRADGHAGAGAPANGWENELLRRATHGLGDVWLAYGRRPADDGSGRWTVGIPVAEDPVDDGRGDRPGPPADRGRPDAPGRPDRAPDGPGAAATADRPVAPNPSRDVASRTAMPVGAAGVALVALAFGPRRRRRRGATRR